MYDHIKAQDGEVYNALMGEEKRQAEGLELIPSENYVSQAVREAASSCLTNKYSEGYPGRRYYGGQEFTDAIEALAIERAKKLFNAKFANVQPHAGAPANLATYFALMEPGDTILGMELSHGGHLTHGHPVTHITKVFNFVRYKMKDADTGEIDYDLMREVALKEKPKVILVGYSAYSREFDYARVVAIAREVGAVSVMDAAHVAGLIVGGAHQNPFDHGFDIILTTTHKTLRGPRGGMILTRENEALAKKIDKAVFPGLQGGPLMQQVAAKTVCFNEALQPSFNIYASQIIKNAQAMASVFQEAGVRLLGGGTSNHLVLADLRSLSIDGHEAQEVLDRVGLTVNKNMIADDPNPPMRPSGIRFGTPAITTRGFKEGESARVAALMLDALNHRSDDTKLREIRDEVLEICKNFPIPQTF